MPVTDFQREVLGVIAANRDEPHGIYGGLTADERKQHR